MTDLKQIILGNLDVLLPNINAIISQLQRRIIRLKNQSELAIEIDDEIIFKDELSKSKAILLDLQNAQQQYIDNDLSLINTHATLELEYFKTKKRIEEKMNSSQKLSEQDIENYNTAVHKYNLFVNIVESV